MLQYERIDVSEGIGINKASKSKECMISHYWYFEDIGFKFQPYTYNGCYNLLIMVYDLDDFMILNIKGVDYRGFLFNLSKNTVIKLLSKSHLYSKCKL